MIAIKGPWNIGFAFEIHSYESHIRGYNRYGHPIFNTKRSPMGQYLYDLKYGQSIEALNSIVELLINNEGFKYIVRQVDIILPVPPSNEYRAIQPVLKCSEKIAELFDKEVLADVLYSTNKEQLKNVNGDKKYEIIKRSINIDIKLDKNKRILIFDDVYDSGSTLKAITKLFNENGFNKICVFTLTKTRKAD